MTEHVGSSGPSTARYAIIGEAPGAEERRQGKPFVGPSGQLLREALERVGLRPEDAYITNVYKEYRSGNPTPTKLEIKEARNDLISELVGLPNLEGVLALGNTPLTALTGRTGITSHRGLHEVDDLPGLPVFATVHPAAILRNARNKSDWLNDLSGFAALLNSIEEDVEVQIVDNVFTLSVMEAAMAEAKGIGALDVETTIGDVFNGTSELVSIAVSFNGKKAYVLFPDSEAWDSFLWRIGAKGKWIMHNGSFDLLVLKTLTHPYWTLYQDTMAMAYLLHPEEKKGLQILSGVYLGLPPYKDVDYKNILDEPKEKIAEMNGRDVARTYQLFRPLADELNERPHLSRTYQWLLLPAISALVDITINGVPLDLERLAVLEAELADELKGVLEKIAGQVGLPDPKTYGKDDWPKGGFNPGSSQQVAHVLFDQMGYPVITRTDTGARSTDRATLEKLLDMHNPNHEFVSQLLEYRKASKLLTAFIHSWNELVDSGGRLHPRYKPTQVLTGRLAAQMPNIQQVPRDPKFRGVFGGVPDYLWLKADLSQIELRVAAFLAQEQSMIRAYQNGEDLHALTARKVFGVDDPTQEYQPGKSVRDAGKMLNFSLLYGAYPTKLMEIARSQYGVSMNKQEAERNRAVFFDSYPRLAEWHSEVKRELHATGQVASLLGRVRTFPEIMDPDEWVVKRAEREAINHPVQSFANDLVLMALVRLPQDVRQYAIADVHDELDFLVPVGEVERITPIIKATMEDVTWLSKWGIDFTVPVLAEVTAKEYWA